MRFVGIDIFTRKKHEDWFPGSESVEIPEVKKYDLKVRASFWPLLSRLDFPGSLIILLDYR
jgi:hypothetical protein